MVLLAALQTSTWAQGSYPQDASLDPPGQVARLNLAQGAVSFAPADAAGFTNNNAWTPALLNRPLTRGDRLWNGSRARSELHIGSTAVRMSELTSLDFLALDDNVTQLRLAQGTLQLRVRALYEGQRLEIDTPNLAFVISQPGNYRLDVNPARDTTRVVVQSGGGVIYGDNGMALNLGSQQQGSFSSTQLTPAAPGAAVQDSFDLWAAERDRHEDQSISARYIPREIIGYQQLDSYGDWQQDPSYGAIWLPRDLPVNWAPYRAGHWSWISPWGWTWVDDAPWGFAPFHYGRWAQIGPRWAWVPGQLPLRPVYAPALVAFVGGSSGGVNWNIAIGSGGTPRPGVGWFPLAPGEAFRPAYRASPRYINRVNNNIIVNNAPDNYRYQRQPAAVTAVSRDDFVRGRVMPGNTHPLSAADLGRAPLIGDRSALPQLPELRERPRLAPAAALPPATVSNQPVVRSRDERGNDRRNGPDRIDERRNDPRAMPGPTQDRSASDAEQRTRREQQQQMLRDQARQQDAQRQVQEQAQQQQLQRSQQDQQDQQRRQNEEAQGQQRALREQAQKQHEQARQQAQQQRAAQQEQQQRQAQEQQLQRSQQDQQRRQNEEAQGQQRALREQAQKQQEQARQQAQQQQAQQLQQAQQQRAAQQEQQRQAQEQQRLQQQEHRQQAQERPPVRPAESDKGRGRRPDSDRPGNQEP